MGKYIFRKNNISKNRMIKKPFNINDISNIINRLYAIKFSGCQVEFFLLSLSGIKNQVG